MGILDNIRGGLSALTKLRITSAGNTSGGGAKIPIQPNIGGIDVVDTTQNPTISNVPGSWSRAHLGPGQPFGPIGQSSARDRDAEKEPRSFEYNSSVNSTISPRIAYGLTPFSELRTYAEGVQEVAMCIRLLTEEMKSFVPTIVDGREEAIGDDDTSLEWMTEHPDSFNPWPVWLSRFLYNVLVYDAGCTYLSYGIQNKITKTRIIDGSTIFVLINEKGEQPRPPAPAFTQVIWGMPLSMMNTKQLWYKPRHLRTDAPYGRSPIEDTLPAVRLLSELWNYEEQKYHVGNIPESVFTAPEIWKDNVDQILEFEKAFNARMSGSNEERVRARFMPHGTEQIVMKEMGFNKESHDAATNAVRLSYGITPSEVGEAPGQGLGGKGYAEAMESTFYRMALAPLISYVESHFDDIIKMNRIEDRKFKLTFPQESLNPSKEEEKFAGRFQIGGITRDEYRTGINMDPIGGEEGKFIITPSAQGQNGDDPGGMGGLFGGGDMPPVPGNGNGGGKIKVRKPLKVVQKIDSPPERVAHNLGYAGDMAAFIDGYLVEMEHADTVGGDEETIGRIVLDHLKEDPEYYSKLATVEKSNTSGQIGDYTHDTLAKTCGVDASDDLYYGARVAKPDDVDLPFQGDNESLIVSIGGDDLAPKAAVWKPESGEDIDQRKWVGGKLFPRSEAVYLLDRELFPHEQYLVPTTFTAEIDGEVGSVMQWVKGEPVRPIAEYRNSWVERAAVLDYISGQCDRDDKNWITHPYHSNRPVLIDNSQSFPATERPVRSSFVDACRGHELSGAVMDDLYLLIGNQDIWDDLRDVLDSEEAVNRAQARAREIHAAGMIPGDSTSPDPDRNAPDGKLTVTKFDESKHPRAEDGKFGSGGGSSSGGGRVSSVKGAINILQNVSFGASPEQIKEELDADGIDHVYGYHLTHAGNVDKLKQDGIKMSSQDDRLDATYLFLDRDDATNNEIRDHLGYNSGYAIVRVKIPSDKAAGLKEDGLFNMSFNAYSAARLFHEIPSGWIDDTEVFKMQKATNQPEPGTPTESKLQAFMDHLVKPGKPVTTLYEATDLAAQAYDFFEAKELDDDTPEIYFDVADGFIGAGEDLDKSWNTEHHPRDKRGRFVSRMTSGEKAFITSNSDHQAWRQQHYTGAAERVGNFLFEQGVTPDVYDSILIRAVDADSYREVMPELSRAVKGKVDADTWRKMKTNIRVAEYRKVKDTLRERDVPRATPEPATTPEVAQEESKAETHPVEGIEWKQDTSVFSEEGDLTASTKMIYHTAALRPKAVDVTMRVIPLDNGKFNLAIKGGLSTSRNKFDNMDDLNAYANEFVRNGNDSFKPVEKPVSKTKRPASKRHKKKAA